MEEDDDQRSYLLMWGRGFPRPSAASVCASVGLTRFVIRIRVSSGCYDWAGYGPASPDRKWTWHKHA
ncbi:hypothetical protein CDL15_Pgr016006 [Punica granatum]|uniref:Uncharacterized protein n=1 Tax=Punica granatum TaxID=22663 RepID=A0A218XQ58_PUNGR|nr:hypothetical protein CDL15_Pgr016006 [Punica granatum]